MKKKIVKLQMHLKIDTGVTYNLDTNVVTIDRAKTKDKGQEH